MFQVKQGMRAPIIRVKLDNRRINLPKGPRGEMRPADTVGAAVMVAKIATGEIVEDLQEKSGRTRSGKAGAKARAQKLTKEERSEIARKAAGARWSK